MRPRDYYVSSAVAETSTLMEYYFFNSTASSNTLDKNFAMHIARSQNLESPTPKLVNTISMSDLLALHLRIHKTFPFFVNIDVEGMDKKLVESLVENDQIAFIMVEDKPLSVFNKSDIRLSLSKIGYEPISSNFLSTLYLRRDSEYYLKLLTY